MEHHWLYQQQSKAGPCPGLTNCFVANTKQTPCYFVNFLFHLFCFVVAYFCLNVSCYFDFHFHGGFVVFYFLFLSESKNIGRGRGSGKSLDRDKSNQNTLHDQNLIRKVIIQKDSHHPQYVLCLYLLLVGQDVSAAQATCCPAFTVIS